VQFVEHGPPGAREVLAGGRVREAKERRPRWRRSRWSSRRRTPALALRRDPRRAGRPWVNVRFLALARLGRAARRAGVGPSSGGGRSRAPLRAEAVRAVLADAGAPRWRAVAGHPGHRAGARRVRSSSCAAPADDAVDQLTGAGDPAASVARLYPEFRFPHDRVSTTTRTSRSPPPPRLASEPPATAGDRATFVLYLPTRLSPGEG